MYCFLIVFLTHYKNPCPTIMLTGHSILELGCGLGLLGACLHRVTGKVADSVSYSAAAGVVGRPRGVSITLTDGDMRTVINCAENLRMNGVPTEVVPEVVSEVVSEPQLEHEDPVGDGVAGNRGVAGDRGSLGGVPIVRCCRCEGSKEWGAKAHGLELDTSVHIHRTCRMLWGQGPAESFARVIRPDVVLGADLLYDPGAGQVWDRCGTGVHGAGLLCCQCRFQEPEGWL